MGMERVKKKQTNKLSAWQVKIHAFGVFRTRKEKCFVLLEKTPFQPAVFLYLRWPVLQMYAACEVCFHEAIKNTLICAT